MTDWQIVKFFAGTISKPFFATFKTTALTILLTTGCSNGQDMGGCSDVALDIVINPGFLTNDISARIVNGSDKNRRVTILAKDPDGNQSIVGPLTVVAKGSIVQPLGPLPKWAGSNKAELEQSGAVFEIMRCE